jgi:hypothetical protein
MIIKLQTVADYIVKGHAPKILLNILKNIKSVFTFTQERANRVKRFVRIINAYKAGVAIIKIEEDYGCTKSTVLRYARLAGLPKRDRGFDPDIKIATLLLYKDGLPISQISAQLGVSQAYVSKTASEAGINRRKFK